MKKVSNMLDIILKILPISVALFLILNYIFNLGYFCIAGLKFVSLLEMRDYYEGTAPLVTLSVIIVLCFVNFIPYCEFIKPTLSCIRLACINLYLDIYIRLKQMKLTVLYFKKMSYQNKKELVKIDRDHRKADETTPEEKKNSVRFLCHALLLLFVVLSPFFQFYVFLFHLSKIIFWILCLLYSLFILIFLFTNDTKNKIIWLVLIVPCLIFVLGCCTFLRNYKTSGTKIILDNNNQYVFLRPIVKGVIVRDNSKIEFYP